MPDLLRPGQRRPGLVLWCVVVCCGVLWCVVCVVCAVCAVCVVVCVCGVCVCAVCVFGVCGLCASKHLNPEHPLNTPLNTPPEHPLNTP